MAKNIIDGDIVDRGYSSWGLLEHALLYNPAYISCVVQPRQIKYMSIPRVGSGGRSFNFLFFRLS